MSVATPTAADLDPEAGGLIEDARARASERLAARDSRATLFGALAKEWNFGATIADPSWTPNWISTAAIEDENGLTRIRRVTKTWPEITHEEIFVETDKLFQ